MSTVLQGLYRILYVQCVQLATEQMHSMLHVQRSEVTQQCEARFDWPETQATICQESVVPALRMLFTAVYNNKMVLATILLTHSYSLQELDADSTSGTAVFQAAILSYIPANNYKLCMQVTCNLLLQLSTLDSSSSILLIFYQLTWTQSKYSKGGGGIGVGEGGSCEQVSE